MKKFCLAILLVCVSAYVYGKKPEYAPPPLVVQRLATSASIGNGDFVYVLPRTVLRVKVQVELTQFTRGVYADYAEKFLGLADVGKKNSDNYEIVSIEVFPMQEADPDEIYVVHSVQNVPPSLFKLQEMGLTLGLPMPQNPTPTANLLTPSDWAIPAFTNMGYEIATYKSATPKASTDSVQALPALPVLPTATPHKSREAQASEAARMLTQLRRRRLELITAEIPEAFVNGEALKTALAEIKNIEQQYLDLFTGKTQRSHAEYVYDVVPEKGKDQYPLFSFSTENGVDAETPLNIVMRLQCPHTTVVVAFNSAAYKYRIPCMSNLSLTDGDIEIFSGRYAIFQYGTMVNLMP
jgi:hypothetical protein